LSIGFVLLSIQYRLRSVEFRHLSVDTDFCLWGLVWFGLRSVMFRLLLVTICLQFVEYGLRPDEYRLALLGIAFILLDIQ
jgi:hypothetical protein